MHPASQRAPDPFHNPSAEPICRVLRFDAAPAEPLFSAAGSSADAFARDAVDLGIGALVYYRLRELGLLEQLPPEARQRLKSSYLSAAARSMIRQHALHKILSAYDEAALPVILLKGAHLAYTVYPDPALRSMTDLDLLVPFAQLQEAAAALERLGYRPERQYWIDFETTVNQHLPPFLHEKGQTVELHWTIRHPQLEKPVDIEAVWGRAGEFTCAGVTARGLSPADLLLHLAAHATVQHHMRGGPRIVYDIAAAVNRWNTVIDWELLAEMAREHRLQKALFLLLRLSRDMFHAPVPDDFLAKTRPADFDPQWLRTAADLLFLSQGAQSQLSINYADLMNARGLPGKLLELLKQVFIPPANIAQAYGLPPSSMRIWLYYPVRLKYLAGKHAGSLNRLVTGDEATRQAAELTSEMKNRMDYLDEVLSEG